MRHPQSTQTYPDRPEITELMQAIRQLDNEIRSLKLEFARPAGEPGR